MGKPLHLIVILQLSSAFAYRYDPWYRADTQRPVDVITDVINELGVRILQQYSTRGNVAFSPTGVAFVLAALYEGSAGRGSQQIAQALGLPANRDVTRIGFRDIHRRLRSYLNADGFLGGLTLSRENTRLRPEYEDILRFYGFDLSSIEQEANVTVSTGDSSGTTKLPTSTVGVTTLPTETTNTGSVPDMTTTTTMMSTDVGTTLPPSGAETMIPSTVTDASTQQPLTMVPTGATDVPSTLAPVTGDGAAVQNASPTQSANSTTAVTSGESVQSTTSAGAESVAGSPNTITPAVNADSQTTPTTVAGAGDQSPQTSPTVAADGVGTGEIVTSTIVPDATAADVTAAAATDAAGGMVSTSTQAQVSSTVATSTEAPMTTNTPSSAAMIIANTDSLAAAIDVNVTPANVTSPSEAILNTVTTNSLTTVAIANVANVTIPSPVTETTADSVVSQPSTLADTPATTDIPGSTATNNLAMTTMTNIDGAAAVFPRHPVSVTNTTSDLVENNLTIANTTSPVDNQTTASLVDENTISMNRKKKDLTDVRINDNTVKQESTNESLNVRKRKARSPRGYFSSYPDEGIWMQDLEIWKSYNTVNPGDSSAGDSSAEISFLVNGCDVSSVSASRYIAVLPFAYFPSLQAVALEFPLDDPRYNIILFMPTDKTDTHRLARDLSGKSLRLLRKRLQPTWVRATIPSFMLRGFVTLTSFLQRLGILDVFEPRVADLSPMTSDLSVYAKLQAKLSITIGNILSNGLFERAGPEPFTAVHPFLYFIIDTETSVSLIAGRVDDPLNSRIL
ncbi:LOW QUALITY PROTEIN: probable GPI-anchored adhesin-like protein PGA55 [Pogonomyrmex barbatus]|uniref:LOW QUALITY PROTEIN: probable GPI-anchored adhesin-like protein PGA55 n=1 Tax=Pogonomyrmex barbatus TaxID=144034 RepID=A0A6I9WUR8_9HYME|nr:LOW QUALITY PROTEIN: probable GPI-anchored adhesin-like protein PGA55 [Pogonomyrmex barbatus]